MKKIDKDTLKQFFVYNYLIIFVYIFAFASIWISTHIDNPKNISTYIFDQAAEVETEANYMGGFGSKGLSAPEAAKQALENERNGESSMMLAPQPNYTNALIMGLMSPTVDVPNIIFYIPLIPFVLFPFYLLSKKLDIPGVYNNQKITVPKVIIYSIVIGILLLLAQFFFELTFARVEIFASLYLVISLFISILLHFVILATLTFITIKLFKEKISRNRIFWLSSFFTVLITNLIIGYWRDIPFLEEFTIFEVIYLIVNFSILVLIARKFLRSGLVVSFPLTMLYMIVKTGLNICFAWYYYL